ncbi:hypothetical protein CVT24_012075 [Panaeolus cyanescens]|uniref:Uncharacterized protein n=1 Tax=Panaeolus cyanescens TaxID=181874 RepID=A0A409YN91_9AGAR|nr:hypothetical protein CVT24_012075 [Panaeolus cyanescens]
MLYVAISTATSAVAIIPSIICGIPLMSSIVRMPHCPVASFGGTLNWPSAICGVFPSLERCNSTTTSDLASPNTVDIQKALIDHFHETSNIIRSSYFFNDNLSRSIEQILLGTNRVNSLMKRTDLPVNTKAAAFNLLLSVRASARETNECIQDYMASLTSGISYILASVDNTAAVKQPPLSNDEALAAYTHSPESVAFSKTMNAFTEFTHHLTESNQKCRRSILHLETKLDHMVNTFVDDAFSAAKAELEEANAKYWAVLGLGRAGYSRAKDNIDGVDKVGHGIERLSAFTVLLDLQLQQLRAGTNSLSAQAVLLSESHLPVPDIMELVRNGCLSLRQALYGLQGRDDAKDKEAVKPDLIG